MSDGWYVDTEALRSHASRVLSLSGKAGEATAAAHQVNFTSGMFGSIGSILVGPFMFPLQGAGVASAAAVEGALGDTAEAVEGLAETFGWVDEEIGSHFDSVGKRIR
ncbi:hypothetical protein [Nocardioides sp. LHG3406-4]|uniref:hypothetical protein n=1 Tax=Nocardioides sp. LHG3406-4 TaxID=2804575 RepID=UPI003CE7666B